MPQVRCRPPCRAAPRGADGATKWPHPRPQAITGRGSRRGEGGMGEPRWAQRTRPEEEAGMGKGGKEEGPRAGNTATTAPPRALTAPPPLFKEARTGPWGGAGDGKKRRGGGGGAGGGQGRREKMEGSGGGRRGVRAAWLGSGSGAGGGKARRTHGDCPPARPPRPPAPARGLAGAAAGSSGRGGALNAPPSRQRRGRGEREQRRRWRGGAITLATDGGGECPSWT